MNTIPEIPVNKLYKACNPRSLPFKTTEEVAPIATIIGQKRAEKAVEFGLRMKKPGYNIFLAGLTGSGKLTYAQAVAKQWADTQPLPRDWCYVYNFSQSSQPRALSLPAGLGKEFCRDHRNMVNALKQEIAKAFESDEMEREKRELQACLEARTDEFFLQLSEVAKKKGFVLKKTNSGFISLPLVNGEEISEEVFEKLAAEVQEEIEGRSAEVQQKATEVALAIRKLEHQTQSQARELEGRIVLDATQHLIQELQVKYKAYPTVVQLLTGVQNDIVERLDEFRPEEEEDSALALLGRKARQDPFAKYEVNLLVDSSEATGAPVIYETNPTFSNLIGRVEYENELGSLSTDLTQIKAGAIHKANGGYLILQCKDVLSHPQAWEALKRVLRNKEVRIENPTDNQGANVVATLQPEPIPVDIKVILTGGSEVYQTLYHYDEDFEKLFKIKAEFDHEMERSRVNIQKMASFISSHCHREGLRHFTDTGVAKVIEYSSRLAEHQEKLSTCFNDILQIVYEADAWAEILGSKYVTGEHVLQAMEGKRHRSNLWEEKLGEQLEKGHVLIDTSGEKVGQVNGLTILDFGDYAFGKPSRITASTFVGEDGVINIERETRMSGKVHDKGLLILSGYLGEKYAQKMPLALSASLCFEQLYDGVDGDSASSTELYAILSSLANKPIRQGLAVTGSVNQKGEIQPIGGVNEKIEGFFDTCKNTGLTGEQGVLIPHQNVPNLMLKKEVRDAVRGGKFRIYPVATIDQGITLLTGVPAGELREDGSYPEDTIHGLVMKKLQEYSQILSDVCD
ncbi:MAG TPA: ATP-binding protein [Bacillota bacterium]|nr:ATP-binding protein [Bacillota bacterium]